MMAIRTLQSIFWAACLSLWIAGPAVSGGGSGSGGSLGVVASNGTSLGGQEATSSFAERHALGIEYASENPVFIGLVEDAALKASLAAGGVPPNATEITLSIKSQVERIDYADKNGLTLEFWTSSVAEVIEVVISGTIPVADVPLTAAKMATAFVTAYTYGFFFGQ